MLFSGPKTDVSATILVGWIAPMLVLYPSSLVGQWLTGSVEGTVRDHSGAVVPGATVRLYDPERARPFPEQLTGENGGYHFPVVPAGTKYELRVEMAGFRSAVASNIPVKPPYETQINVGLEVGAAASTVEITLADVPLVISDTSGLLELPLTGRNWVDLQQTLPGVVASSDFGHNFAVNGGRSQDNSFMINGTDSNDLALNPPLFVPSPDAIDETDIITNTINPQYGRDAWAILNAVPKSGTNAFHGSAFDFYRDPSLNARNFFLPKPDQFHQNQFGGTVGGPIWKNHTFFFFSFEGTRNRMPIYPGRGYAGGTTTVFTQDQLDGIFPDVNADANALGNPTASPFPLVGEDGQSHPAGTLYSTLFPSGHIPAVDISPVAANLIKAYMPLPNYGDNQFSWNPVSLNKNYQYITRIDHTFSAKDSLSGYWIIEQDAGAGDEPFSGGSLPGFGETQTSRTNHMNLTWNHSWGSNAINDVRMGYGRLGFNAVNPAKPVLPSSLGFTGINPQSGPSGAGVPCIDMSSYEPLAGACLFGFSYDGPQPRIDQTYEVTDNFSWIHGTHTIKAGFDMRRAQVWNPFYSLNNGYFQFYGTGPYSTGDQGADFMLGIPDRYHQSSGGVIDARTQQYYSYFQDQWKVRPNLTLTYGVGWQVNTPQNDIFNGSVAINAFRPGQQSTVFPTAPEGLLFPGDAGISTSSYGTHWKNLAPRLGFAWSPEKGRKWSIRAGFGIYFNQLEGELTLQILQTAPFSLQDYGVGDVGGSPSFADPWTDIAGGGSIANKYPFVPPKPGDTNVDFGFFEPMTLRVFDPNLTTPSAYNYNLTIQRELLANTIVQVGYVGYQGRHLTTGYELNPPGQFPGINPVAAAAGADPTLLGFEAPGTFRYDPFTFASVGVQATDANSNYNSFQIAVTRKTTHGFDSQTSYTWSHSLDSTSSTEDVGGAGAPNPFNRRSAYGDSSYDARQRFVISYSYEIPSIRHYDAFKAVPGRLVEGWRIAGYTTLQTGFPLGLSDGSAASLTCWTLATSYGCSDRPNVVGSVKISDPRNTNLVNSNIGSTSRAHYYFDPNSFAPEETGVIGNAGRNFFHGPGYNNFDFAVFKDTEITEHTKLELRFEFFNLFNHTQFTQVGVGTDINSSNFGRASAARAPRIIQLAAKFYF